MKHDPSIYASIEDLGLSLDLQGWHSDHPIFAHLVAAAKPATIIEVGSWKGASAIHLARLTASTCPRILCVDTWLGSREIWANDHLAAVNPRKHGYPQVYFQFLHNVHASGFADRITPLPMTSSAAARMFQRAGTRAELVYIDGEHEFDDALADLRGYWPLVAPGGIMFGDDYKFLGVQAAVTGFALSAPAITDFTVEAENFWILRKSSHVK